MAIKTSKSAEGYYAKYAQNKKEESNRKLKLQRQLRLQPGNSAQIELAIKNIHHRRKKPVAPYWSHSMISTAMLLKEFTGKFDKQVFSADPATNAAANKTRNINKFTRLDKKGVVVSVLPPIPKGSMFSLAARAHNKDGSPTWA